MNALSRVFKYVWPQWHRLIVVIVTAVTIGFLFSVSFMTIIPLLKVMMGEEGLHSWVDRKVCSWRYGVKFYVPDTTDFTADQSDRVAYHLLVLSVEEGSVFDKAGVKPTWRIVGVNNAIIEGSREKVHFSKLLAELADTERSSDLRLQVRHPQAGGKLSEIKAVSLDVPAAKGITSGLQDRFASLAQWGVGFIPQGSGSDYKQKAIVIIIGAMLVVTIIRCTARFYQEYLSEKVVQTAVARLREDAFSHTMNLPVGFIASNGSSDTTSRLVTDINSSGNGIKIILNKALREPLKAIFCLGGAMLISWQLTLIFLACAPPTIGLAAVLGSKIKKHSRRSLKSSATMLGRLEGAIAGLKVVKVYNRQGYERGVYRKANRKFVKHKLHAAKIKAGTGPVMEILGMLAGSAALIVGVHWVTNSNMQSSSFFALLVLMGTSAESIRKASDVWNKIQNANAAAERVFEVVDQPAEPEKEGAKELPKLQKEVEFRDIYFTYPGADTPVLKGVNLKVPAGHNVAVVGPNGSGKTTLMNLVPRFYNPDSGQILIDGMDIDEVTLKSLRDQIGIVTQNVVTFNDTIRANIGYGNPEATDDQIIQAARRSYADEFVRLLPAGYDTVIGEHGAGLSGGQLQRIIIARAILKDPSILIFDEAMSQVDADSETKIHKALEELMHHRTCFVIAHRFSTVVSADRIVVMDSGTIVAQGSHKQLIKDCKLYQNLYETQLMTPTS